MSSRTIFLSRLLGLFLLAMSLALYLRKPELLPALNDLIQDAPRLLILSVAALLGGLAIVLTHNIWSGGALPVVVTLLGWALMMRGLVLLLLPHEFIVRLFEMSRFADLFYLYAAVPLVLGLYLTFAGFTAGIGNQYR